MKDSKIDPCFNNVNWVVHGAMAQDVRFMHQGVDLSKQLHERVNELPGRLTFPEYGGRKIAVYKTNTEKPIYFGFGEVSNGCFCYWLLEPQASPITKA